MPYPVTVSIEPQLANRNRLTTAFRLILAVPHAILVGPIYFFYKTGSMGLLAAVAYFLAIVSWFTVLFANRQLAGIRDFSLYYLRWRTRAIAYMALLVDPYPPFGDAPYPASVDVTTPAGPRDKTSIALRIVLVVPHLVVLFFLLVAWFVTSILAWFSILLTGGYPASLHAFGAGVMRWLIRVEAYMLLLVDEYPPFALE